MNRRIAQERFKSSTSTVAHRFTLKSTFDIREHSSAWIPALDEVHKWQLRVIVSENRRSQSKIIGCGLMLKDFQFYPAAKSYSVQFFMHNESLTRLRSSDFGNVCFLDGEWKFNRLTSSNVLRMFFEEHNESFSIVFGATIYHQN